MRTLCCLIYSTSKMPIINKYFRHIHVAVWFFTLTFVIHFKSYSSPSSFQNLFQLSGQNAFVESTSDAMFDLPDINLIFEDDNDETESNNNEAAQLPFSCSYSFKENIFTNLFVSFLNHNSCVLFSDTQRKLSFLGFFII